MAFVGKECDAAGGAEGGRGLAGMSAEESCEIVNVWISDGRGDLLNGAVGVEEHFSGGFDTQGGEIIQNRFAVRFEEKAGQMPLAEMDLGGDVAHAEWAGEVVVQISGCSANDAIGGSRKFFGVFGRNTRRNGAGGVQEELAGEALDGDWITRLSLSDFKGQKLAGALDAGRRRAYGLIRRGECVEKSVNGCGLGRMPGGGYE